MKGVQAEWKGVQENERKAWKSHYVYESLRKISRKEVIRVIHNRCYEWMTRDILVVDKNLQKELAG